MREAWQKTWTYIEKIVKQKDCLPLKLHLDWYLVSIAKI